MPVVRTEGLSKWYGDVVALNDVTLEVPSGLTGLLGPNGAGKTTLLHLITGQLRPSQGDLQVMGRRPWKNPAARSELGFVPETLALWDRMTGTDHVALAAQLHGARRAKARKVAGPVLERVGLDEAADRRVGGYSRGMRQRLKLAMALVHEPELLVLDEPFTGLDPVGRRSMMDLLRSLASQDVDILFSSHVLHEVETLTRNIVVLVQGRVVAVGDVHEIRSLMDRHPHHVRLTVDRPRALAQRLVAFEDVVRVQVGPEEGMLEVQTRSPDTFYRRVQDLLLDEEMPLQGLTSPDDNLQAVFSYLTREEGA